MHQLAKYDVYIFDCDGVILNSNQLKIEAMEKVLLELSFSKKEVKNCVAYFIINFGKSRFHHVDVFLKEFLNIDFDKQNMVRETILEKFSIKCKSLYLKADYTPEFLNLINVLEGFKYVASGSEEKELRDVFKQRGLEKYFQGIYGSPTKKETLVKDIVNLHLNESIVMIGDAISDFESANANGINFIFYRPYSNVKKEMKILAMHHDFSVIDNWFK
jgi:phosphoglycolate phosphatase-like HAD superfamily hydrolase